MSDTDYASMKIIDLKKALKSKGLPVSGNKQELIERLEAADGTALLDENDDELDQVDEQMTEEAIKEAEKQLEVQGEPASQQNISLTEEDKENTTDKSEKVTPVVEPEDKIKARAERFGGFQSDEAKKAARAARFADMLSGVKDNGTSKKIGSAPAPDLEILKKRAERFGSAVSPLVKEAEVNDAIKRRQERFGVVSKDEPKPKKLTLNAGVNSVVLDEKLKTRKERFGL